MEETLDIPCTDYYPTIVDNGFYLNQSINLLSMILDKINCNKILELDNKSRNSIDTLLSPAFPEFSERLNALKQTLLCAICKTRNIEIVTSCEHGYCLYCLESHITKESNNMIILNESESNNTSAICIKCNVPFTIEDLKCIFLNIPELEMEAKLRKIHQDIETKESFTCMNCGIMRGKTMFTDNPCSHMCKICISAQISQLSSTDCKICGLKIAVDNIVQEQYKCSKCQNKKHLVGDYLQEVCAGKLYCLPCTDEIMDSRKCYCHDRIIDKGIIIKILSNIFKICDYCNQENHSNYFLRHTCCEAIICYKCTESGQNCRGCGKLLNDGHKKQIAKFFSKNSG